MCGVSDGAIEAITTHVSQRTSPMSNVLLYPPSGAYSEVDDDATAFGGGRSARLDVVINAATTDRGALAGGTCLGSVILECPQAARFDPSLIKGGSRRERARPACR